jgi:GNAT superfamily N-acetyltransferase
VPELTGPGDTPVRQAVVTDALAIAEVHVAAWQAAYAGLLPAGLLNSLDVAGRAADWVQRIEASGDGTFVLVLEREDSVRGFVSAGPSRDSENPGSGEVYAIYTAPGYQGGGVGSLLLTAAVRRLAQENFSRASLWVLAGNDPARRFYESRGWSSDGAAKQESFGGIVQTEVRYVCSLSAPAAESGGGTQA